MEAAAFLYFLRKGVKVHFYSLVTICEENVRGVQRGETPCPWAIQWGRAASLWARGFPQERPVRAAVAPG